MKHSRTKESVKFMIKLGTAHLWTGHGKEILQRVEVLHLEEEEEEEALTAR